MNRERIAKELVKLAKVLTADASRLRVKDEITIGRERVLGVQDQPGGKTGVLPPGRYKVVQIGSNGTIWLQARRITDKTIWGVAPRDAGLQKILRAMVDKRKVMAELGDEVVDILNKTLYRKSNELLKKGMDAGLTDREAGKAIQQAGLDWFDAIWG